MNGTDVRFRRIANAERMLDAVVRRRVERAVFAELGLKPFWWPQIRG